MHSARTSAENTTLWTLSAETWRPLRRCNSTYGVANCNFIGVWHGQGAKDNVSGLDYGMFSGWVPVDSGGCEGWMDGMRGGREGLAGSGDADLG